MMASISLTRRKDSEFMFGQMVVSTKVGGIRENNMESEHTVTHRSSQLSMVCGRTGSVLSGLMSKLVS
jgi:hypothetical protein